MHNEWRKVHYSFFSLLSLTKTQWRKEFALFRFRGTLNQAHDAKEGSKEGRKRGREEGS